MAYTRKTIDVYSIVSSYGIEKHREKKEGCDNV